MSPPATDTNLEQPSADDSSSSPDGNSWFVRDDRVNALITWTLTAVLVLAAVDRLLSGRAVAALFAVGTAGLAALPPVLTRSRARTVPWPILAVATFPYAAGSVQRTFAELVVAGAGVAALAMLAVVALQLTTTVRITSWFAVPFVFLVTLAVTGLWTVVAAASATYFGGAFVETNAELMRVYTAAAVGGLLGGLLFRWYFRRQLRASTAPTGPEEVTAE